MLLNPYRFGSGGGAPGNIAVVGITENAITTGSTPTGTGTRSCTAGNTLLVAVRFYGAVTINSASCSGETVTVIGSAVGNGTNNAIARTQYVVINDIVTTGSKTVTVTFSANANDVTLSLIELSGTTASPIGAHAAVTTGIATTNPTGSITTTASGSMVFAVLMSSGSGATAGTGYTLVTNANFTGGGFVSFASYEFAELDVDVGSAGTKSIPFVNVSSTSWHIDAIEILST